MNYVDSEGEKIVFVNGYLIKKERNQQGEQYWRDSFVQGAQSFFKDYSVFFTNIDYWFGSSSSSRRKLGYYYAKENYASLIDGVSESDSFNLVSHSMGGAFSMGIKDYLEEQGWSVKSSIFINTYQSDKIILLKDDPSFTVDYQNTNDPVLFWLDTNLGKGRIRNADITIRVKSDYDFDYIHKGPISSGKSFWDNLQIIINRSINE